MDHNQLPTLDYLPPGLKLLTITFNQLTHLSSSLREIGAPKGLEEVDFSFNPARGEPNYKLHLINSCPSLKKVDGMKVTRLDLEMAVELSRMLDEEVGLIPSSKFQDLVVSKFSTSQSTVISNGNEQ